MEEIEALIALNILAALFTKKIHLFTEYCDSAAAFLENKNLWPKIFGEQSSLCRSIEEVLKHRIWEKEITCAEKKGISLISLIDPLYPSNLKILKDRPLVLYTQGDPKVLQMPSIAIVGTRACTLYGKEMAYAIARETALLGFAVASGLARGIDTAAHEGALCAGRTIAVLGSGLNHIYPSENAPLAEKIAQSGCIVSELPLDTPPSKRQFPSRNRIVASLAQGVLLIEAPLKSGAMITMELARHLQKKCFAIPGRMDYPTFQGNHALIKKGEAALIDSASEMCSNFANSKQLHFHLEKKSDTKEKDLNSEEVEMLALFSREEMGIDQAAISLGWPIHKIQSVLMQLVLKKRIAQFGNVFKKPFIRD